MSIRQKFNWLGQQRVDLPHLKMLEDSLLFDFKNLCQMIQGDTPYVLTGFKLATPWTSGNPANSLQVIVENSNVIIPDNSSGSFLVVTNGTPNEQLTSANSKVIGSFTPNTTNFVAIQFNRVADSSTADLVAFWDNDAQTEFTKTVPLGLVLNYQFVINTTGFGTNSPICKVQTDAFNNIISIENCKQGLFRLGSGGSTPDSNNEFTYSVLPENPLTASASSTDPFAGGDWEIQNLKQWMDAVMTEIKRMKGSAYWYSPGSSVVPSINLTNMFFDTNSSVMTGSGSFTHNRTIAGQISWDSDIYIRSIIGKLYFRIPQSASPITLSDTQVGYIELQRNLLVQSGVNFTFANSSPTVNCSVTITDPLIVAGNWIKAIGDGMQYWTQIQSVLGAVITLTDPYPGPNAVDKAVVSVKDYNVNVASPLNVTNNGDTYWLAKRDDNAPAAAVISTAVRASNIVTITTSTNHNLLVGNLSIIAGVTNASFDGVFEIVSVPALNQFTYDQTGANASSSGGTVTKAASVYLKGLAELQQGEIRPINDNATQNIIDYIGSKGESDNSPTYSVATGAYIPNYAVTDGDNLTKAVKELDISANNLDNITKQDRNLKLVRGGTWSFANPTLTWSADAFIQVPDLAEDRNKIAAGNVTLTSDGDVAYVEINRVAGAPATLTVSTSPIASLVPTDNTVIIARKLGTSVIIGSHSFLLINGESKELDSGLSIENRTYLGVTDESSSSPAWNTSHSAPLRTIGSDSQNVTSAVASIDTEIDKFFGQFRLKSNSNQTITITGSDVTMLTGETRSQMLSSLLTQSAIHSIDFQTGIITPNGSNFIPVIPAAGQYRWLSIGLLPLSTTLDQKINLQVLVIAASADGASAALAPKAPFSSSAFNLGQVVVTSSDGINISSISSSSIVQLGIGSGSGSGGNGSGIGDDLDSLTYRASFRDDFTDLPSSAANAVDYSAGKTDQTTFSLVNHCYRLAYDASKTIAALTTTTNIVLSSNASYTVKVGDIVRVGTEARRISAVISQSNFTTDAFSVAPSLAAQVTVSQAVYTVDLNNFIGSGQAISASFSSTINDLMVQYGDSVTANDIVPDWNVAPEVAFDASASGASNPTPVSVRAQGFINNEQITIIPVPGTNLYLRFFSNLTSGSGFVNLLSYRTFFHREVVADFLPQLSQASGRTDGLGSSINCTVDNSGSYTIIKNLPTYSVGVNPGTIGGQLEVYLNGQKLPRFLDSSSTPAGWYLELNGNEIRLDKLYSSFSFEFEVLKRVGTIDTSDENTTRIIALENVVFSLIGEVKSAFLTEAQYQAQLGAGWVLCDGRNVSGSTYAALTGNTTIPDMRSTVPRMKDNGAGLNPDGDLALGSYQADQFASHNHTWPVDITPGSSTIAMQSNQGDNGAVKANVPTTYAGGNETRAKSTTINFFIRIN